MIGALCVFFLIPVGIGYSLLVCLWPPEPLFRRSVLKLPLGAGLGLGLSSCSFFVWLLMFQGHVAWYFTAEISVLICVIGILLLRLRRRAPRGLEVDICDRNASGPLVLPTVCFLTVFLYRFVCAIRQGLASPHGGWDAWAIWNQRARFIFRSAEHWKDAFSVKWSLLDYPLFLPISVARAWYGVKCDTVGVPIAIAVFFTMATALLLFASVSLMRTPVRGGLAGLVLLQTPFFMSHGMSQYADVPLAFYLLATFALFCAHFKLGGHRPGLMVMSGMAAGLAAWTKNEGSVFLVLFVGVHFLVTVRSAGTRSYVAEVKPFLLGVIPVMVALIWFKIWLSPGSYLLRVSDGQTALDRLLSVSRYRTILAALGKWTLTFGEWHKGESVPFNPVPALLVLLAYLGLRFVPEERKPLKICFVVLGLQLIGYVLVYGITPCPLRWQIACSMNRVLLQLWPSFLFLCFVVFPSSSDLRKQTRDSPVCHGEST